MKFTWPNYLDWRLLGDILLHVGFIGALLGLIFFTVGGYVEKQVTKNEVASVVDGYLDSVQLFTTKTERSLLSEAIVGTTRPDMTAADATVAKANKALIVKAAITLSILLAATILITVGLAYWKNFSMKALLFEMMFIVVIVACTELFFLFMIARNYKAVDPNYLKFVIATAVKHYVTSP